MDLSLYGTLSNDQIRRRLTKDFGQNCGPITSSTRNVLIKKLAKLEANSGDYSFVGDSFVGDTVNGNGKDHRNNSSNDIVNTSVKVRKSSQPPKSVESKSSKKDIPVENVSNFNAFSKPETVRKREPTPKLHSLVEREHTPKQDVTPRKRPITPRKTPTPDLRNEPVNIPRRRLNDISDEDEEEDEDVSPLQSTAIIETSPPRFTIGNTLGKLSPKNLFSARSSMSVEKRTTINSLARPALKRNTLISYSDSESEAEDIQSDKMTKILMNHRQALGPNRYMKKTESSSKVLSFFGRLFGQSKPAKKHEPSIAEHTKFSQSANIVSRALVVFVILFFVLIVGLFFGLKFFNQKNTLDLTDYSFIEDKSQLVVPICGENQLDNCIASEDDRKPTLNIVRDIRASIDHFLTEYFCVNSNPIKDIDKFLFTPIDLKQNLWDKHMTSQRYKQGQVPSYPKFLSDFDNALTLIRLNPSWNMRIDSYSRDISVTKGYSPNFSLQCQASVFVRRNVYPLIGAILAFIGTFFSAIYCRHTKKRASEEQSEMDRLIEESIELLQSPDEPQSMPVLHIRDTLIPTSDRQSNKYKKIWQKVVSHMENSESRVKVEFKKIDGEDFKAWKWIGSTPSGFSSAEESDLDSSNNPENIGGLRWQGTAFSQVKTSPNSSLETSPTNVRKKPIAPTKFMKVRNYYDKSRKANDPNYADFIESSILKKVVKEMGSHDICHIGVTEDEKESLIYIKCGSIHGAADVFSALHGWWCEGVLVSVRYLKEDRYYQHFPDSRNLVRPIEV